MQAEEKISSLLLENLRALENIETILVDAMGACLAGMMAFRQTFKDARENRRRKVREGKITTTEWESLKAFYGYTCLRCGKHEPEIKLTRDHVKPLSMGGENSVKNLQPLCQDCNHAKGDIYIDYRGAYIPLPVIAGMVPVSNFQKETIS